MLDRMSAQYFQDIIETDDIGFDVGIRMIDRIAYACLGSQIDDDIEMIFLKQLLDEVPVSDIAFAELSTE